jgi:hypothetical protein
MPKGPKGEKRPRDLSQWAKRMVGIATGEVEEREPTPEEEGKDPAAVALAQNGHVKASESCEVAISALPLRPNQR